MAAVSSSQTTAGNYTNGYDRDGAWDRADENGENYNDFDFGLDEDAGSDSRSRNGNNYASAAQMATRRMKSADNLAGDRWDESVDNGTLLPAYDPEGKGGRGGLADPFPANTSHKHEETRGGRDRDRDLSNEEDVQTEQSKWIHRDKLARIESEELQAAGIFVPRSRAPSKQRQDRSRSAMRRGTDASDQNSHHSRSRKNSAAVEQRTQEVAIPAWDLRTPEEIAEEEANAYFTSGGLGGTKIPVAKTSPAPISLDHFERGSGSRKHSESPEGDDIMIAKTRSRSASASLRAGERPIVGGTLPAGKRSATEGSPKKNSGNRKPSSGAKNSAAASARPKTRSGSSNGTRPSTRSGESPPNKQPEGDPPWMVNSYKPDPRLPPDQQLLPTVARRLQQEKWEKEGTYGDTYDKEFRPLNDKNFLKPPEGGKPAGEMDDAQAEQQLSGDEWPLKPEAAAKSPSLRQGSYSTMPKISDKAPTSPMASPRPPQTPQMFQTQMPPSTSQAPERVPNEKEDEGKKSGGCGCCLVM